MPGRYDDKQIGEFAEAVITEGFCILPNHFPPEKLINWRRSFLPLLDQHISREGHLQNRGPARYYASLY
jgi:hypothetical protein